MRRHFVTVSVVLTQHFLNRGSFCMTTMVNEARSAAEAMSAVVPDAGDWMICASGLRKKYCRDLRRSLWYGVSDVLGALSPWKVGQASLREHEFWAVDDVSVVLRRGDSLGLLGANGAGKSTLIKLLTGQRTLTAGTVQSRGRVVALTELGLGFDLALTGRENAYVNAAVYGVSQRKFDQLIERIIDFSELRAFIDSAVHTYSKGMKARLGFSVATHLSPDILIVDEVLAVGDMEFRRKCVQHILAYLKQGGSVVLVAHDPYLVQSICNRAIVLEQGKMVFEGSALEGADFHFRMSHANMYTAATSSAGAAMGADVEPLPKSAAAAGECPAMEQTAESRQVTIERISVVPLQGETLRTGCAAKVSFDYHSRVECDVSWGFTICTRDLNVSIASCAHGPGWHTLQVAAGVAHVFVCAARTYVAGGGICPARGHWRVEDAGRSGSAWL